MKLFEMVSQRDKLDELLDREHRAIVSGRFDQLEKFSADKERLVRRIGATEFDAAVLQQLRQKALRNEELLAAMGEGLTAAQTLLRSLQQPKPDLQTYDPTGRKRAYSSQTRASERRI